MAQRIGLRLACLVVLASCASPDRYSQRTRESAAPFNPVFATQLAGPSTYLAPMPTAIVVLKPDDLNRNRAFCSVVTTRLPTAQQALASSVVAPNIVLTRWLVQLATIPPERAADCDFLVGTYDYARAARLLANVRLTEGQLSGPGPFLLMVIPDRDGWHVAGLDGSGYAEAEFPRFVDTWGSVLTQTETQVTQNPEQPGLIRSVFDLVSAILRVAAGVVGGVIEGVITAL